MPRPPPGVQRPRPSSRRRADETAQRQQRQTHDLELAVMRALGQGITINQPLRQAFRQGLDHRHLQRQPPVDDLAGEGAGRFQQIPGAPGQVRDHLLQRRRGAIRAQGLDRNARRVQGVPRHIDPVDLVVVLAAVLQVVDHLQRRAQGVIGRPGRARLAVHIQHEPPDRHGRIAAIVHQLVPAGVACLGHVAAEGFEQVQRVLVGQVVGLQGPAQALALGADPVGAGQPGLQLGEQG